MRPEARRQIELAWVDAMPATWREIDGKLCAVMPMILTWALMVDVTEDQYEYRYCYGSLGDALGALLEWESLSEHPPGPWIKLKGHPAGELAGPATR